MGRVKNMLFEQFDANYEKASDDDLINDAFDINKLNGLDRDDMVNLIEELARRYQNLLMVLDASKN